MNELYYSLVPVDFLLSIYSSAVSCRTNNIGLSRGEGDTRFIKFMMVLILYELVISPKAHLICLWSFFLWAGGSLARIYRGFSRSVSQPALLVHKILLFHWIVLLWTFRNHSEFWIWILSLLEGVLVSFLFSEIWSVFKASSKFMTWLVYVSKTQIPKYSNHSYFIFLFICKILYTRLPEH